MLQRLSVDQRFWAKVDKLGPLPTNPLVLGPCWMWNAYRNRNGYGMFGLAPVAINGVWRYVLAHRWLFEQVKGPIPTGMELDHLCRVPACVNPDHLESVTHTENMRRAELATGSAARHGRARVAAGFEVPAARFQRSKTHCPRGHAYDEKNTHVSRSNRRTCRACARERWREKHGSRDIKLAPELVS